MRKKSIHIGVIGCGTVGSSFVSALRKNKDLLKNRTGIEFSVIRVSDKDKGKVKLFPDIYTPDETDITDSPEIDIVVELIGGVDYAEKIVRRSIKNHKCVVTANKALISEKGMEIFKIARENGVYVGFEASVAGAIPIIKVIRESFVGNRISRLLGILNGTTNYILTNMSLNSLTFSQSLMQAQKRGYAEANPTLDIGGFDTAQKLSILSGIAFGRYVNWQEISVEGIKKIDPLDISFTKEFGYRVKLLAIAQKTGKGIDVRVHPTLLPDTHPLSPIEGVYNAVYLESDLAGQSLLYGEGAGGNAATSAVISDVVDIGMKLSSNNLSCMPILYEDSTVTLLPMKEITSRYYFRFTALDKPGVLSQIARILGKNQISIASVIQKQESPEKAVPILMLTHTAKEELVQKAIADINKLSVIKEPTVLIRLAE